MKKLSTGELEGRVMDVLWSRGGWLTPGDVHEVIAADHSVTYSTVMTILVRLWRKGRLDRERDGRAYAYHPRATREEDVASRMQEILGATHEPAVALAHFVEGLGRDARTQLRRVLGADRRR